MSASSTDTTSLAGQHVDGILDNGDIDSRKRTIHKAHDQNRYTAWVNFKNGGIKGIGISMNIKMVKLLQRHRPE